MFIRNRLGVALSRCRLIETEVKNQVQVKMENNAMIYKDIIRLILAYSVETQPDTSKGSWRAEKWEYQEEYHWEIECNQSEK